MHCPGHLLLGYHIINLGLHRIIIFNTFCILHRHIEVSLSFLQQEPRSSLQRVGYRLDDEGKLLRLHWRVLDRAQDSAPIEITLVENIESMEWRYLNATEGWIDRWPPPNLNALGEQTDNVNLPRAVELRLESKALGDIRHLFYIPQPAR